MDIDLLTKLSYRQKMFCDYYIETLSVTEAAKKAGYSCPSNAGSKLLKLPHCQAYIKSWQDNLDTSRVMSAMEILEYLTKVVKNDIYTENEYIDKDSGEVKKIKVYPSFKERNRAAELLGKRYNLWNQQVIETSNNMVIDVTIDED